MAVPAAVLSILVQANTGGATRGLMRFNSQLGATEAKSNRALGAVKTLAKGSAVATGIGLGYAVKKAADFEQQLDSLGSVSDASGKQMEQFRKQAMKAGADTKFSALDAAEAQTELAKGGLKVRQIMRGGLAAALSLAAAGEMELGEAAATTANALNLFGLEGKSSMKVADALAKAANATTADVTDFAMALRQSGGVAKTAGLSFSETVLALEALANAGTKNSDAGTSLKTALIQLIKPTEKQMGLANKLNLEFLDAEGNFKNLADVSSMLRDRLGGMTAAQRTATLATLAGTDGVRTLTALYDAGPQKLDKWKKGLNESGTAAEVAAQKQDNLKGKLENLQGSIETAAIGIGTKLLPTLTKAATEITKLINDPKLTGGEKFARFMEMVTQAVEKAIPVVAAAGVKIAGALAAGLARGWREMNPLMKLFTAAAVIRLVGGRGVLLKSGVAIGTALGAGVSAGAVGAAAGGAGAAAAGGGLIASMRAKVLPVAKRLGLAGVGIALADSVISEFGRRSAAKGGDMVKALDALKGPDPIGGDLLGKVDSVLPGVALKESEQAARRLIPALEGIQKAQRGIGSARAQALRQEIGKLSDATPELRRKLLNMVGAHEKVGERTKWLEDRFQSMRTKGARSFNELAQRVQFNTKLIRETMGTNSKRGQQAMTENFIAAARNVRQQMREAGKVTKRGTELIEMYMVQALQNMGFNKADALALRRRGKGSKQTPSGGELRPNQRGGPIMEGALSGDSVPSILERGEYVLNRKAVRAVGKSKLDQINFKQAPRFAKGGSVGIQNMVAAANQFERAGFPYDYGGGHQATPAPFGPVDCSGAVSYVLQHGGVKIPTMVSGAMTGIGKPGRGAVTVYANPGHVLMSIMGRFFGTSTSNPDGGAGWIDPAPDAGYLGGFTARHFGKNDVGAGFPGMGGAPKLPKVLVDGPDSLLKANAQAAISNTHAAAQEKLNNIAAQAAAPIGTGDAGTHTGSWKGGSTRAFAQRLASKVGLSLGSGYRTPAYNASVGGAPNSMHTHGTVADPGAWDVPVSAYGSDAPKGDKLAALGRAARLAEVIWKAPDHYDHVHLGFFQKGGLVEKLMGMVGMQSGGAINTAADALRKAGFSGSTLIRMIAEAGGESGYNFKAVGDGGASKGMLQIHTGWNPWAAGLNLFDPYVNAEAAKRIYDSQGVGAWHADHTPYMDQARAAYLATKGGGSGDSGGGGGKGARGGGSPIGKLAYVGDSLGQGTLGAGLKGKLGKINLAAAAKKGATPSWGAGALKGMLGKGVGAAMLDMGTNGSLGDLRSSIDGVEGMLKGRPLVMASLDPQAPDAAKKNAAMRSNANVVVPWGSVAQRFASDKVHPTGAGYGKRASMIAAAVKNLRSDSKDESGLTDREKKQLKTPLKGSVGKVLTKTLKVLRSNKPAKFRGTRLKQLEKRIKGMDVGLPDGIKKQIANLRKGIEEVGGNADAASSFNVDNEDGTTSLGVIRGKTEAGWVTDQLDMLFRLRNKLIDAKKIVEKHRAEVQKLIERMQKRLQALAEDIRTAAKAKREAEQHLKQLQKHPQRNREAIKRQKAVIDRIEGNQSGRVRERDAISDKILPALTGKRKQFTAFINENIMGSDGLPQIQGLGSPLEKMTALPPVGVLLGDIFDAQMRLRELAAPATSITDDATSPETSESAELLKQLLQEANLRTAVSQKQYEVLRNMPPYGGQFATGGVVPGPIGAARTIVAHGGETVTPPGNGASNVQINLGPGMEWLDKYIEVKVDGVTRKQARAGARGLPGRGGGF